MYPCPNCNGSIADKYETVCPGCRVKLAFCTACQKYTERKWHRGRVQLQSSVTCSQLFATCQHCGEVLWDSPHIHKTSLFQHFPVSFKFVNRYLIPYPMYFHHRFPIGEKVADLGLCLNPFVFEKEMEEDGAEFAGTDIGPARAYRIAYQNKTEVNECIALSHESGLEIFPGQMAASRRGNKGCESLQRSLEFIETSINWWWDRYKSDYWGPSRVFSFAPLIERIIVRTRYWEFSLEESMVPKDRGTILEQVCAMPQPPRTIDDFAAGFDRSYIREKILGTSKRISELNRVRT